MDVFSLRDSVVGEYEKFARSFTTIHAADIRAQVEQIYADGRFWPDPLIQINPSYRRGKGIEERIASGALDPRTADPCHRRLSDENALANSQLEELDKFVGNVKGEKSVTFGRYTGQEHLLVGTPIAGRVLPEIEPLIGFFVNTLVMRGDLSGRPTFEELLRRTRERALAAYAHQDLPFERLVDELQVRRDISRNPLFQVMFALQDAPLPTVRLDNKLTFAPVEFNAGTAQFDLLVSIHESAGLFRGSVKYSTDLFDAGTVARFMKHYQRLLEAMTSDPQQRVFGVPLDDSPRGQTKSESEEPASEFDFTGLGDN